MANVTKTLSMFVMSVLLLGLLVMIVLGFMLGFSHPLPWVLIAVLTLIPFIHDKIVATRFVEWKESYSVGIESIDNDHKKLLGLINQLQSAAHYHTDSELVDETLKQLLEYTEYHFSREEEMMKKCEYPEYEQHKQQHAEMISQVYNFVDQYRNDGTRSIEEVAIYLKNWLVNHINGTDQKYTPYLKNNT